MHSIQDPGRSQAEPASFWDRKGPLTCSTAALLSTCCVSLPKAGVDILPTPREGSPGLPEPHRLPGATIPRPLLLPGAWRSPWL